MNNRLKGLLFLSMVALSGPLSAQTTPPDSLVQQTYPVTDSLRTEQPMAARSSSNCFKLNPLSLVVGQLSLFYERALSRRVSVVAGYGVGGSKANFGSQLEVGGVTYQRVTFEVRRYWASKQLTGFYMGPYVRWSRLTVSSFVYDQQGQVIRDLQGIRQTANKQASIWIPGLMVGRQYIKKWFCLDAFIGIQRQFVVGSVVTSNQVGEGMTAIWAPRIGLSAGIAF